MHALACCGTEVDRWTTVLLCLPEFEVADVRQVINATSFSLIV